MKQKKRIKNSGQVIQCVTLIAALFAGWFTLQAATNTQQSTEIVMQQAEAHDYVSTWKSGGIKQYVGTYRKDYASDAEASAAHKAKVDAHKLEFPVDPA